MEEMQQWKNGEQKQEEMSYLATMLKCTESLMQIDSSIVAIHIAGDQSKNTAHFSGFWIQTVVDIVRLDANRGLMREGECAWGRKVRLKKK